MHARMYPLCRLCLRAMGLTEAHSTPEPRYLHPSILTCHLHALTLSFCARCTHAPLHILCDPGVCAHLAQGCAGTVEGPKERRGADAPPVHHMPGGWPPTPAAAFGGLDHDGAGERMPPHSCFCCCASCGAVAVLLSSSLAHGRDGGHVRCGCLGDFGVCCHAVRALLAVGAVWRSTVLFDAHLHKHVHVDRSAPAART